MINYKELDKELKKIRNNKEYDLYKMTLESQKKIDEFYSKYIDKNEMIGRMYKLEACSDRQTLLYYPIIITIIFGLLVNIIFAKFKDVPNFVEMFQKVSSVSVTPENINLIMNIYAVLAILIFFVISSFALVLFAPILPLNMSLDITKYKSHQRKYELKVLDEKINKIMDEQKRMWNFGSH